MIEFENVTKAYGRDAPAVTDLNLVLPSRRTSVIVGPSGCGKTTTLRMINRMLEPSSGRILWDGEPLTTLRKTELRRHMGYVIQSGGLFPHRTVADNIATVCHLLKWPQPKVSRRVKELMELTELAPNLASRFPAELSGGQQQRVGVARALAADPEILLMDEPFSAVDPVVRSGLQDLVRGLQRELSKTIVMITHDIDEAISLGDQVVILRQGGILAQVGPPTEILTAPADEFVRSFVGRDRGYRGLGFAPATDLPVTGVRTTRQPGAATTEEPVLVLDERGRPRGWVDPRRPSEVMELGTVFDPATDSLRAALDSALSSPVGRAIAVTGTAGRYAGVITITDLMAAIAGHQETVATDQSERRAAAELAAARQAEEERLAAEALAAEALAAELLAKEQAGESEIDGDVVPADEGAEPDPDAVVPADEETETDPDTVPADNETEAEPDADAVPADEVVEDPDTESRAAS